MRGLISFLLLVALLSLSVNSQTLHFEEDFDYDLGKLPDVSTDWIYNPDGSFDIEVIDGNLGYSGYENSSTGRKINLNGGASGRTQIQRSFPLLSANGNSIYVSFLLNVTSTSDMDLNSSTGDYFAYLAPSTGTAYRTRVHVRQGSSSSKYSIGLGKSSTTGMEWFTTELDVGTTYLIVISYHFQAGDDETRLWVNPSLAGAEPSPDISLTSGSDASDLQHLKFKQDSKTGDMDIDGIRASNSWSQAPLPVELTTFEGEYVNNSVQLNWETATETNNAGFEVQRQYQVSSSEYQDWVNIGFVVGHGTTNSPKYYLYIDEDLPNVDKVSYRLKQIDNDGIYSYSKTVEVELGGVTSVEDEMLFEFALEQNYPNPFNPVTTINFTIPNVVDANFASTTNAVLKVYNLLGQEVRTLVNEVKPTGNYQLQFDASDLPSGIYFYSLTYGNHIQTRKLALLK